MPTEEQARFFRVFNSLDGKKVLEKLEKKYPEVTDAMSDAEMRHAVGQRSVIKFIKQQLDRGGSLDGSGDQ